MEQEKIQQMQFLEQNLQSLIMQKQAFQMEFTENATALKEIQKTNEEEVYKIIGQLMIKVPKDKTIEDLKNKEKLIETRINSLESQMKTLQEQLEGLRKELIDSQK